MRLRRIDHIGIVVKDLAAAKDFFLALGMEVMGEREMEGALVDRVIGLKGARSSMVMMETPEGDANIELIQFHAPEADEDGSPRAELNVPGIRHLAFLVEDLEGIVAKLKAKGGELIGELVNYEGAYKLCCLRGPEGIILELAEEL